MSNEYVPGRHNSDGHSTSASKMDLVQALNEGTSTDLVELLARLNQLRSLVVIDTFEQLDFPQLFDDAGLPQAKQIAHYYIGFLKMSSSAAFPDVDVNAERGLGIPTVVGAH